MTDQNKPSNRFPARDFVVRQSTFVGTEWHAGLAEHHSFDDCMDPSFWRDVVHKKPQLMDEIRAVKADLMSVRYYLIVGVGPGFVKLSEVQKADGPVAAEIKEDSPLKTRWNPGKKGHEVIRQEATGQVAVMAGPFQTKPEAVDWITDHLAKMKVAA